MLAKMCDTVRSVASQVQNLNRQDAESIALGSAVMGIGNAASHANFESFKASEQAFFYQYGHLPNRNPQPIAPGLGRRCAASGVRGAVLGAVVVTAYITYQKYQAAQNKPQV